jgi:hypothetical protein
MWSYSGDPSASDRDQVRFYSQDVIEARPLLQDEELDFLLSQWADAVGSSLYVAAVACEVIAGKFAASVNVSADGMNVDQGSLQQKYNDLAASLRDQYKALYQYDPPDLTSVLDQSTDWSILPLTFGVGFQDNNRAGLQDYGSARGLGKSGPYFVEYPEELW